MPKIRKINYRVSISQNENVYLDSHLYYSSDEGFYIPLPVSLIDKAEVLSDEKLKSLNISKKYRRGYNKGYDFIISAKEENNATRLAEITIRDLVKESVKVENVIIISLPQRSLPKRSTKKDFPVMSFSYGLIYAEKLTTDSKTVYRKERATMSDGNKYYDNLTMHTYRNDHYVVLPDTPKNREHLEQLYEALYSLQSKLIEHLDSEESVRNFLHSSLKLIGL